MHFYYCPSTTSLHRINFSMKSPITGCLQNCTTLHNGPIADRDKISLYSWCEEVQGCPIRLPTTCNKHIHLQKAFIMNPSSNAHWAILIPRNVIKLIHVDIKIHITLFLSILFVFIMKKWLLLCPTSCFAHMCNFEHLCTS